MHRPVDCWPPCKTHCTEVYMEDCNETANSHSPLSCSLSCDVHCITDMQGRRLLRSKYKAMCVAYTQQSLFIDVFSH